MAVNKTMEDLAKLAGVSKITVSRALRDSPLVTEETRQKVRAIAEAQGYRFNVSARNLRMGRSYSVAVVVEMTPAKGRPAPQKCGGGRLFLFAQLHQFLLSF